MVRCFAVLAVASILSVSALAQSITVAQTQTEISVVPGFNHVPLRIGITYRTNSASDLARLSVSSDASWVSGTIDTAGGGLNLAFATANLINRTYTATVTVTDGSVSAQTFVRATIAPMNITKLVDDPVRSRTYGIQQDGLNGGSIVVFDPLTLNPVGNIAVGKKPCDLAVSADGNELLVICSVDKSIMAIDLRTLAVRETIALPVYTDWGQTDTSAHVDYGPGNILYYTDGAWTPVLHVLNRSTRTALQNVLIDGSTYNANSSGGAYGFGDIAVSHDQTALYGWGQYGWTAGITNSFPARFVIKTDGTVAVTSSTSPSYAALNRDPLNTPVLISNDDKTVIIKQTAISSASVTTTLRTFPAPVFAISPNAEIVSTQSAIYDYSTGNKLLDLPVTTTVQAITSDYARLVYFDATAKALKSINLFDKIGTTVLKRDSSPTNQAIVLPPAKLQWASVAGVDRYRVYLGESLSAVKQASPTAPEFLGLITGTSLTLATALTPGKTYYWRVDVVTDAEVVSGDVQSFTVSTIASNVSAIDTATVRGHSNLTVPIALSSAAPGKSWTASSTSLWIRFAAAAGTTPATLNAILDASALNPGVSQGEIKVTGPEGTFTIPVRLQVDALALTVMRSDPVSARVYAISEATVTSGMAQAYLLEIDSLLQTITRVVPVGSSATDLAIHHGDNRIYVPNWKPGGLLAVNLTSFQVEKTYATSPFDNGYNDMDVYRVSAGTAGRLVTEAEDQWINVSLFNTTTGAVLKTMGQYYQGGGQCDPSGRYYYHGDSGISDASLHKIDLIGDTMTEVKKVSFTANGYYGARTVVISEDGSRVFWNAGVFDKDLTAVWSISDEIFATSADGQYAFSETKIYDVPARQQVAAMPVSTKISAYNSTTGRLVVQNGNALGFYSPVGPGLLGAALSPKDGSITLPPAKLQWKAMAGVDSYRVFLGRTLDAVTRATVGSPEYLGAYTAPACDLQTAPISGQTYYWRVDLLIGGNVVASQVQSFTVSTVAPSVYSIEATTVQGHGNYQVAVNLTSATSGVAWTASSASPWISFAASSGTTPATLQVKLDASQLPAGLSQGSVTVTNANGSCTLPVKLQVDPLALTVMRSDPTTSKVYAISEATVTSGASRAYLLEIDSQTQVIARVISAGSSVSDLAVHRGDNRVYIPNWKTGALLAVNLGTFGLDRTYAFKPFGSIGYGGGDIYRVAAGGAGRLVIEEQDQWINIYIFDTGNGVTLGNAYEREGGGLYTPEGRYYYHGDNNSSGAELHRFDTVADKFAELAHNRGSISSYYGSRVICASEDGHRIFWAGSVFKEDLTEEWALGDIIYATSADGRYAFGESKIYDVPARKVVFGMPTTTKVSAFNSTTGKLVLQQGSQLGFYTLTTSGTLPAPALAADTIASTSVKLTWTENALQNGFTLQMRAAGAANWTDVSAAISSTSTSYTVTGLQSETAYEFHLKADNPTASSGWSNIVAATTLSAPPSAPSFTSLSATSPTATVLQWTISGTCDSVTIERSISPSPSPTVWTSVAANRLHETR